MMRKGNKSLKRFGGKKMAMTGPVKRSGRSMRGKRGVRK